MTTVEARDVVTRLRAQLDAAMRAVSVPEPDWRAYCAALARVAAACRDAVCALARVATAERKVNDEG